MINLTNQIPYFFQQGDMSKNNASLYQTETDLLIIYSP